MGCGTEEQDFGSRAGEKSGIRVEEANRILSTSIEEAKWISGAREKTRISSIDTRAEVDFGGGRISSGAGEDSDFELRERNRISDQTRCRRRRRFRVL